MPEAKLTKEEKAALKKAEGVQLSPRISCSDVKDLKTLRRKQGASCLEKVAIVLLPQGTETPEEKAKRRQEKREKKQRKLQKLLKEAATLTPLIVPRALSRISRGCHAAPSGHRKPPVRKGEKRMRPRSTWTQRRLLSTRVRTQRRQLAPRRGLASTKKRSREAEQVRDQEQEEILAADEMIESPASPAGRDHGPVGRQKRSAGRSLLLMPHPPGEGGTCPFGSPLSPVRRAWDDEADQDEPPWSKRRSSRRVT